MVDKAVRGSKRANKKTTFERGPFHKQKIIYPAKSAMQANTQIVILFKIHPLPIENTQDVAFMESACGKKTETMDGTVPDLGHFDVLNRVRFVETDVSRSIARVIEAPVPKTKFMGMSGPVESIFVTGKSQHFRKYFHLDIADGFPYVLAYGLFAVRDLEVIQDFEWVSQIGALGRHDGLNAKQIAHKFGFGARVCLINPNQIVGDKKGACVEG
ncbi:MAG: hypothetical protein PHT38_01040 [Halothiobacillus sp.]|jgi:hypothetical protein|nr:hypothetical protein [Halothiobacillus sp.]